MTRTTYWEETVDEYGVATYELRDALQENERLKQELQEAKQELEKSKANYLEQYKYLQGHIESRGAELQTMSTQMQNLREYVRELEKELAKEKEDTINKHLLEDFSKCQLENAELRVDVLSAERVIKELTQAFQGRTDELTGLPVANQNHTQKCEECQRLKKRNDGLERVIKELRDIICDIAITK